MTEHKLNREEAEAAARAGAKVRWAGWGPDWLAFEDGALVNHEGDSLLPPFSAFGGTEGWSIVTPAPTPADVGPSDTAKMGSLWRRRVDGKIALLPADEAMLSDAWMCFSDKTDWQANTGTPPDGLVDVVFSDECEYRPRKNFKKWPFEGNWDRVAFWRPSDTAKAIDDEICPTCDGKGVVPKPVDPVFTTTRAKPQPATEGKPAKRKWGDWEGIEPKNLIWTSGHELLGPHESIEIARDGLGNKFKIRHRIKS